MWKVQYLILKVGNSARRVAKIDNNMLKQAEVKKIETYYYYYKLK